MSVRKVYSHNVVRSIFMLRRERRHIILLVKVRKNVFAPWVSKYASLSATHLLPVYPVYRRTEKTTIKTSCLHNLVRKGVAALPRWPGLPPVSPTGWFKKVSHILFPYKRCIWRQNHMLLERNIDTHHGVFVHLSFITVSLNDIDQMVPFR